MNVFGEQIDGRIQVSKSPAVGEDNGGFDASSYVFELLSQEAYTSVVADVYSHHSWLLAVGSFSKIAR